MEENITLGLKNWTTGSHIKSPLVLRIVVISFKIKFEVEIKVKVLLNNFADIWKPVKSPLVVLITVISY